MNDNAIALDPQNSVVVEACAGSGKTWLLVSRIVRLLLDGVQPGEILAITFTRKAAQEMQARLRDWLYDLATKDDEFVRKFLRERAIAESDLDTALPKARGLYQQFLLAQPVLTINTFHGWFMQIVQRAPLDAGMAGGVRLVEQTGALWDEASQLFYAGLHQDQDSAVALAMRELFGELGLFNTQKLLQAFAAKRSEWWAYTAGQVDPLAYALEQLRDELQVDEDTDPIVEACADAALQDAIFAFSKVLATGTETQGNKANDIMQAWEVTAAHARYAALLRELYTLAGEPRSFKPTKKQDAESFLLAREVLFELLQAVIDQVQAQQIYSFNQHAMRCGVAMLERYQALKQQQQSLDFADLEWRVCQLLNHSPHAEYLQYKLDSRYQHVLLDEFQDTNPLQWQILQAWFAASAAVGSTPKIFVVGDPKQSIYRFRRADARLFGVVCEFLMNEYDAKYLQKNETRRNAPAILETVNAVFDGLQDGQPKFEGYETHSAHQTELPGHVQVMPLAQAVESDEVVALSATTTLRNPLLQAYPDREQGARELEAQAFADQLCCIVGHWSIRANEVDRLVQWGDIMVLVRSRTHLKVYEQALRTRHIPFLTSRRGGLLDTLESSDIQALLTFLMTPFADLQLAQVLRSPLFSCSDTDLMSVAAVTDTNRTTVRPELVEGQSAVHGSTSSPRTAEGQRSSWWQRLQNLHAAGVASVALQRAHEILQSWLVCAEHLPVHDLLDRIYFEADAPQRYAAAVPSAMRATVLANLQAFMEIALNVDAGRYPSLSRFLRTLSEMKQADDNEAPNEGAVDQAGDALRIYTVHESKGLEAPLVWLLDSNAKAPADKGYDVLLDWPTNAARPAHLSLYADKASHGAAREKYFAADQRLAEREDMNLLYVAMTRAKQILFVSGSGKLLDESWYARVAAAQGERVDAPLLVASARAVVAVTQNAALAVDPRLTQALPTGTRKALISEPQRRGVWLHALLQYLASSDAVMQETERSVLQNRIGIPATEMDALWSQAQQLLTAPSLTRYFDANQYLSACNEMPYVNARGELKRIDRLVEFDDEVWVLDYKLGESTDATRHHAQMQEYKLAMQSVYTGKQVRCALIFGDGVLSEM
ncbi:MAG: UvrD-helicase domain-containing protein [Gallionella sp.]